MNVNALTLQEIIRTVEPETDLEQRLFYFLTNVEYVDLDRYQCPDCEELSECEDDLALLQDDVQRTRDLIGEAIKILDRRL